MLVSAGHCWTCLIAATISIEVFLSYQYTWVLPRLISILEISPSFREFQTQFYYLELETLMISLPNSNTLQWQSLRTIRSPVSTSLPPISNPDSEILILWMLRLSKKYFNSTLSMCVKESEYTCTSWNTMFLLWMQESNSLFTTVQTLSRWKIRIRCATGSQTSSIVTISW